MIRTIALAAMVALTAGLGACANRTGDSTVAAYCADPRKADEDICKLYAEDVSTRTTLGGRIEQVFGVANDARSRADRAQSTADSAMTAVNATQMHCVTRTMRNQQAGSCDSGYTLTGCTQTRYTTRAGGMAILRSVNDQECRFNTRVLEMQVRCCYAGPNPPPATLVTEVSPAPERPFTPSPRPVS